MGGGSKTIIFFSNFSNVKEKNTSIILGRTYYLGDELVDDEVGVFVAQYWALQKRKRIRSEIWSLVEVLGVPSPFRNNTQ